MSIVGKILMCGSNNPPVKTPSDDDRRWQRIVPRASNVEAHRAQSAAEGGVPDLSAAVQYELQEQLFLIQADKFARFYRKVQDTLDGLSGRRISDPIVIDAIVELMEWAQTPDARAKPVEINQPEIFSEEDCPGHVASDHNPKVCGRCGFHIDSFRPDDDEC